MISDGSYFRSQGKSLKDIEKELGGVGREVTITMKIAGLVDFGNEVQLLLPNKMFTYLPTEVVLGAING